MKQTLAISRKFYSYQKERFPIAVLGLSLLPAALSSAVVVSVHPSVARVGMVIAASLAYLLHIRIIDEHRDYRHDNIHHADRPVQAGIISKGELQIIDFIAASVLVAIAAVAGPTALAVVGAMLAYSYLAGVEFFVGEKIRRHFFTYNIANLLQMLLMQIFVYSVFANTIPLTFLVAMHFLFTTVGTIVFEFVRKIKMPGDDGTGRDTYTWYLGFNRALVIFIFLALVDTALFFKLASLLSSHVIGLLISAVCAAILVCLAVAGHWLTKTRQTDQLMQLSFLVVYGAFNLALYFFGK
jgi:hypothetical protein